MNCICHDVVQQGHGQLIPFYHLLLVNCYNKFYNNDSSDNDS